MSAVETTKMCLIVLESTLAWVLVVLMSRAAGIQLGRLFVMGLETIAFMILTMLPRPKVRPVYRGRHAGLVTA